MSIFTRTTTAVPLSNVAAFFEGPNPTNPVSMFDVRTKNIIGLSGTGSISVGNLLGKACGTGGLSFRIAQGYYADNVSYFNSANIIAAGVLSNNMNTINTCTNGIVPTDSSWSSYTVEWKGYYYALATGTYTFYMSTDDAGYVYVNDALVVSEPGIHGQYNAYGNIALAAGQVYALTLLMGENAGGDGARFDHLVPDNGLWRTGYWEGYVFRPSSVSHFPSNGVGNGLVGWYDASSWTGTQWSDKSGIGNHATTIRGTINVWGDMLWGNTSAGIRFPAAIVPSNYTLFHVAKYNGATKRRIFDGVASNWLSGFWNGVSGIAYHEGWVTQYTTSIHDTEWIVTADQRSLYRSNGQVRGTGAGGVASVQLSINYGLVVNTETSDWAVREVIVFNRQLSLAEIVQVETYLLSKYNVMNLSIFPGTVRTGLIGWYDSASWTGTQWNDKSGTGNHVTDVQGTVSRAGDMIYGNSDTILQFPMSASSDTDPYTLVQVSRFNGRYRSKIFSDARSWFSGHCAGDTVEAGRAGVVSHGNSELVSPDLYGSNWLMSTDQRLLYRANGRNIYTSFDSGTAYAPSLLVLGDGACQWAVREVLVYNRELTAAEIATIEAYLISKYNIITLSIFPNSTRSQLIGWYDRTSWDSATNWWFDVSGTNYHATVVQGTINVADDYIYGNTNAGIRFQVGIVPNNYTLFHVARYNGSTKRRIIDGVGSNWLSGHWDGRSGIAFHGNWITAQSDVHGSNWVVSTDQQNLYRSNGVQRSSANGVTAYDQISVNYGYGRAIYGETSDWAVREIMVFNAVLTAVQIATIESYLRSKYKVY